MAGQLKALFEKGITIPTGGDYGRQVAAETGGDRIYVLHQVAPFSGIDSPDRTYPYIIVKLTRARQVVGVAQVTLKGVVYVAGPMRGYDKFNFPAFDVARDHLIKAGFFVFNPADLDRAVGVTEDTTDLPPYFIQDALDRDSNVICKSTHIYLLPGWEESSGVRPEGVLGDAVGIKFIADLRVEGRGYIWNCIPSQAVCAVIGGRLVAKYQKWLKETHLAA